MAVNFIKNTKETIDATPIVDGQVLWTTDQPQNKIYSDNGTKRVQIGGTIEVDNELSTTSTNAVANNVVTNSIDELNSNLIATKYSNKYKKIFVTGISVESGKIPVVSFINFKNDPGSGFDTSNAYLLQDYLPDGWNSSNTIIMQGQWLYTASWAGSATSGNGAGINTHLTSDMCSMYARYPESTTYAAFFCLCMRTDI